MKKSAERILALILVLAMSAALVSCAADSGNGQEGNGAGQGEGPEASALNIIDDKYRNYYEQKTAAKLIGKSPEILHEEKLGSSSRLLSTPEKITHLVIVRGKALCTAALRYGDNYVPLIGAEKTRMTFDLEAKCRGFEIVDSGLLGNADEMKRLLRFDEILEEI